MNIIRSLIISSAMVFSSVSIAEEVYEYLGDRYLDKNQEALSSIPVPNAFRPEGIVRGFGSRAYVGSLADGSIYQVDLLTGEGSLLVDNDEGIVVGLAYDERTNYLYAAGGPSGLVYVYDAADGELKQTFVVTTDGGFVNDGIVTENGAYFTNTLLKEIYHIPLSEIGRLPELDEVETIPLGDGFEFIEGSGNGNGIETTPDGKNLLIVNTTAGKLYKVDPLTGEAQEVILEGGDLLTGDGLLLRGNTLYVMQNRLNQIAEISLDKNLETGVIERIITNDLFRVPTTITSYGKSIYAINARFDVLLDDVDENTDYDIVRTSLKSK